MFVTELRFECFADTTISAAEKAINQLLEAYRANGQILGREFAVAFNDGEFRVRLLMPEKSSLAHKYHSPWVKKALAELTEAKLLAPRESLSVRTLILRSAIPTHPAGNCSIPALCTCARPCAAAIIYCPFLYIDSQQPLMAITNALSVGRANGKPVTSYKWRRPPKQNLPHLRNYRVQTVIYFVEVGIYAAVSNISLKSLPITTYTASAAKIWPQKKPDLAHVVAVMIGNSMNLYWICSTFAASLAA